MIRGLPLAATHNVQFEAQPALGKPLMCAMR